MNNSIKVINKDTFYGCTNLSNIEIPDSVITIGESAFRDCPSLTDVFLPSSIEQINDCAFAVYLEQTNLDDLDIDTYITCMADNPPTIGYYAFGNRNIRVIYVPMSSAEAYKTAERWSQYADVIVGI